MKKFQFSGNILEKIKKVHKIRIGLQKNLHPFHIDDPVPGYPGIDVDLSALLVEYLDVEVEYHYYSVEELIHKVHTNQIDLAFGGISSNLERGPYVMFSRPYLTTTAGALVSKQSLPQESGSVEYNPKRFRSLWDLSQAGILNIGVQANTANQGILQNSSVFSKHVIKTFETKKAMIDALKAGSIDAFVADVVYIKSLMKEDESLQIRYTALVNEYRPEYLSIVMPRGDLRFKQEIDFFLNDLARRGILKMIEDKYLKSSKWVP